MIQMRPEKTQECGRNAEDEVIKAKAFHRHCHTRGWGWKVGTKDRATKWREGTRGGVTRKEGQLDPRDGREGGRGCK